MGQHEQLDEQACQEMLRAIADGTIAFEDGMTVLWPSCLALARRGRALRGIGASDDDVREVGVRTLERLGGGSARAMGLLDDWLSRHPGKDPVDWLRIVVANIARDYVRARVGGRPVDPEERLNLKARLNVCVLSLTEGDGASRPPFTAASTAREVVAYAKKELPEDQGAALSSWLMGAGFEEIGEDLGLAGPEEAKKLLRAAVASLRRRFG
jgi:hypothetical protein